MIKYETADIKYFKAKIWACITGSFIMDGGGFCL
jgi:hypothetical protein